MKRRILISGAGIGGPALAWWMAQLGWDVTVVERAPALREGGQAVDFRGPVHREVLERMGLWDAISAHRTRGSNMVLLGRSGRPVATLPSVMMSGDLEILRGDLSRLLYERTAHSVEYRFGDHLTALDQSPDDVTVQFASGSTASYDLVVGADGLHSGVRALAFGDESKFARHQGYRIATYSLPNILGLNGAALTYTVPGRACMVTAESEARARALFVFAGAPLGEERFATARQQELLRAAYHGVGWEVPRVLAELPHATDLYVDQIATIAIDRYAKGRVVLLGDAAYGGTLGGQGTSLAIVGAHVLAGELAAAPGDHVAAFRQYEARMRPYATSCQKGAERVGSFFAPRTHVGLLVRDLVYRAFTSRLLIKQFEKIVKSSATAFELPDYEVATSASLTSQEVTPGAPTPCPSA
jgi:2-polyprenyl-6-methoxyphenol hydroxylase-like FAD-dependent oxidoreductase